MTYRKNTNFVWTDLSSYDTKASRQFYAGVFGWEMYDAGKMPSDPDDTFGMDAVNYHVATTGDKAVAGIFDMPPFFQKIKMPPFWMSYLAVDNIEQVVARAKTVEGVIVDIEPTPFGDGLMALIRDPNGAGFTCYDGPSIDSKGDGSQYGQMVWNELITSDISAVEHFYRHVLGFDVVADNDFYDDNGSIRVKLINQEGEEVAGIQQVDESTRGNKVYWLSFFSVDSVSEFSQRVTAAGGEIISQTQDSAVFYDNTGACFAVTETGASYNDVRPWHRRFLPAFLH